MENIRGDELPIETEAGSAQAEVERGAQTRRQALAEWARTRGAYLFGGACLIGVLFAWLQFSTGSICCGDYDGYYHVKWSRMLWEGMRAGQFPPLFTVLPLTTLNAQDYVDHHFLFHVLQIPFTWFHDMTFGAKVGTLLFSTLAVFSCYWLVVRYRLRYPLMWLLALLACSAPFLYRMNMAKAMSVSIVLMIAGIYLLFERKYLWLAPLAFLFALAYDMFALLCVAAFVWAFVVWWNERRVEWMPVVLTISGSIAGFVINPYFPRNIRLFAEHLMMKVTSGGFSTEVGGEWYPYNSWEFLMNCFAAFVATLAGYIAFNNRGDGERRNTRAFFFLIFSTILLVANAKWKRFSEYWPPFAILFAAFSLQTMFDRAHNAVGNLPADVLNELQPYLDRNEPPATIERERRAMWKEYALVGSVVVYLCFQMAGNVSVTARDIANSSPPDHYKAAADWMHANIPPGEMIFNTDWDDFPRLFYFAPEYRYVSGLDPTYLQDKNPKLSDLYKRITVGDEDDPGPFIRQQFGARYVFSDNEHEDFYNKALDSGWFDEVYVDDDATILHIRDAKGEPPPIPEDDQNEDDPDNPDEGEPEQNNAP